MKEEDDGYEILEAPMSHPCLDDVMSLTITQPIGNAANQPTQSRSQTSVTKTEYAWMQTHNDLSRRNRSVAQSLLNEVFEKDRMVDGVIDFCAYTRACTTGLGLECGQGDENTSDSSAFPGAGPPNFANSLRMRGSWRRRDNVGFSPW